MDYNFCWVTILSTISVSSGFLEPTSHCSPVTRSTKNHCWAAHNHLIIPQNIGLTLTHHVDDILTPVNPLTLFFPKPPAITMLVSSTRSSTSRFLTLFWVLHPRCNPLVMYHLILSPPRHRPLYQQAANDLYHSEREDINFVIPYLR